MAFGCGPNDEAPEGVDGAADGEASLDGGEDAAPDAPPVDAAPPDACVPTGEGEVCNGEDDDCDGETDEGFPGVGVECDVGVGACERTGFTVCDDDGLSVVCSATPGAPDLERCGNAVDENCDGALDDGFGLGMPCDGGDGDLCREGVAVCSADGRSAACDDASDTSVEACNGADDDCDGSTDEGIPAGAACDGTDGDSCLEGNLMCLGGTMRCSDATGTIVEACNGADDDCEGGIDEDWPLRGTSCSAGVGACSRPGTWICNGAGTGLACNAVAGTPGREFCGDGIDGDCSGGADPTCPANDRPGGAIDVSAGGTFSVDLRYANDDAAGSGCGGSGGRDVFYQLSLGAAEVVYLDTLGSTFDSVVYVRQGACAAATVQVACQDDACGSLQTQLATQLGAGTWCVVVDQFSSAQTAGSAVLRVVRGGRTGTQVPLGASTQSGNTCASGTVNVTNPGCAPGVAPDRAYWFTTCPGARMVSAQTCGTGTSYDTVLYLRAGSATSADLLCSDDACSNPGTCDGDTVRASSLSTTVNDPGLFWIVVDGFDLDLNCDWCGAFMLSLSL